MSEFKWTDSSVEDFVYTLATPYNPDEVLNRMRAFKASKRPKKEWEILLLRDPSFGGVISPDTVRIISFDWLKAETREWPIHSVKRLSDGEVFTVGDEVGMIGMTKHYPLKRFDILDGDMIAWLGLSDKITYQTCVLGRLKRFVIDPLPVYLTPSEIEKLKHLLK